MSDSDETSPDERYIQDKMILKIAAQTDKLFKSCDTSKVAWQVKNQLNKRDRGA